MIHLFPTVSVTLTTSSETMSADERSISSRTSLEIRSAALVANSQTSLGIVNRNMGSRWQARALAEYS